MSAASHSVGSQRLPFRAGAFVALVCIVIVGLTIWREWTLREITLKAEEVNLANHAQSLTQHAEDSFDLMDTGIVGVVSRLEAEGASDKTLAGLRKVIVARKRGLGRIHSIVITDENGNWLASSGAGGAGVEDREFFRHHRESADRSVFVGPPFKSDLDGEWVITVSRRFNRQDGGFAGVVFATITSAYFSQFYRQFDMGAGGAVSLLSARGVIVARTPDDGSSVGLDMSKRPLFSDPALQIQSGVLYLTSPLDGSKRVSFFRRSDRFPVVVLATRRLDDVLGPWRRDVIGRMIFVGALVSLIAVIGAYLVRQLRRGQQMATALAAKEASFRMLAEGSSDMVTRIGLDERIEYASPSSLRILGWQAEQLEGTQALAAVNPLDLARVRETLATLKSGNTEEARVTYRTRHREKSEVWVETAFRVTRNIAGLIDGVIAITRDVTEQKGLEDKLAALAIEDCLTGLANRRRFDERLSEEWTRAQREGTPLSLLMIDLDHFKAYNDKYGHPTGDECLRKVAGILTAQSRRPADLAARFGGEEFAVLLPNTDADGCAVIGEQICRAVREFGIPHALSPRSGVVTTSVGGAVSWPGTERSGGPLTLIEAADRALYAAKNSGRNRLVMAGEVVTFPGAVSA